MKTETHYTYICDFCGRKSNDRNEIVKCECQDTGLSETELFDWNTLQIRAKRATCRLQYSNNTKNKKLEDKAYDDLITFEKEHNINYEYVYKLS